MNWQTYFIWKPAIFTFRVLGFGVFLHHVHELPISKAQAGKLWLVPILPNWRFAFVAPWL